MNTTNIPRMKRKRIWNATWHRRSEVTCDIEQGHISSASCMLANIALRLHRTLAWDPDAHQVIGDEEANRLLARAYRPPWKHPTPETV